MKRGLRNNNPLNIRRSADRWEGERMEQTDPTFVQFTTMAYGYRAAWKVLESYWKRFKQERKPFTVGNIIARWAPHCENETEAYVKTVLKLTALGGNERLPRPFRGIALDKLGRLVAAMTVVECGIRPTGWICRLCGRATTRPSPASGRRARRYRTPGHR